MSAKVTADDIAWAAEWVSAFEIDDVEPKIGTPQGDQRDRVVAWLLAEVERRQHGAIVRAAAKQLGRKPSEVRAALRRRANRDAQGTPEFST